MSVVTEYKGEKYLLVKGSPLYIKSICLPESIPEKFDDILRKLTFKGFRIISYAWRKLLDEEVTMKEEEQERDLQFFSIVLFENKIKESTKSAIEQIKKSDICPFIITGDNIYTSINIALRCKILTSSDELFVGTVKNGKVGFQFFSKNDISRKIQVTDEEVKIEISNYQVSQGNIKTLSNYYEVHYHCLHNPNIKIAMEGEVMDQMLLQVQEEVHLELIKKSRIFASTTPDQKVTIINKFKQITKMEDKDHQVGFVGDGMNDCKALQKADFSLALGQNEQSFFGLFQNPEQEIEKIPMMIGESKAAFIVM